MANTFEELWDIRHLEGNKEMIMFRLLSDTKAL